MRLREKLKNIKWPQAVKETCREAFQIAFGKVKAFIDKNFAGTNKGVRILMALILSIMAGGSSLEIGIPGPIAFIVVAVLFFFLFLLAVFIGTWVLKLVWRIKPEYLVTTVIPFVVLIGFLFSTAYKASDLICVLLGVVFAICMILFARSFWSIFKNKVHTVFIVLLFVVTLGCNVGILVFFLGDGFRDTYISDYLMLITETKASENEDATTDEGMGVEDESTLPEDETEISNDSVMTSDAGNLTVASINYGTTAKLASDTTADLASEMKADLASDTNANIASDTTADLASETTDLSSFVSYEGIGSKIRSLYWGHGMEEVPLSGKVWYPVEGGNYPVMFIIHGNHIMTAKSHLGYEYLGEYLASFGYVVVTVDENFLNGYINMGLSNENDARAILLLENIGQLKAYNEDVENPLYEKIDYNNIALAGHSRGGEAVAIAALFNEYERYPDNGYIQFDYEYAIKSIIAIAPSCDQYMPTGKKVELEDINYLLIHGSNDQDVSATMGLKQYDNITFSDNSDCFKSYIYIAGANHGQFNSLWGKYDQSFPNQLLLNTANLISEEDQQEILKVSMKLFLDTTLKGKKEKQVYFENVERVDISLPDTIYIQSYEDSGFEAVCSYEEDTDITTANKAGTSLYAAGMNFWGETSLSSSSETYYYSFDNSAVQLRWKDTFNASYRIDLSERVTEQQYLQFDIMDIEDEAVEEGNYKLTDLTIELEDSTGNTSQVLLSEYATIYPPFPVRLSKLEFISDEFHFKHHFQTVRIPLEEFEAARELDINKITRIKLIFNQSNTGNVMIDNIGFSK